MEVVKRNVWEVRVPAGKYVLGDPCYCFSSGPAGNLWDELGESCDWFQDSPVGTVTVGGKQYNVLGFGTAYGDGEYSDNYGQSYPVDAGLIGLVPLELVEALGVQVDESLHKVVELEYNTTCTVDEGDMAFGRYRIDTRD